MIKSKKTEIEYLTDNIHEHCINFSTREIYMHGYYASEGDSFIEYRLATTFIKNLNMRIFLSIKKD